MRTQTIGHRWRPPTGARPAVSMASEVLGERERYLSKRILHADWTLDYEFGSYGRSRVKSARAPWRARLPRTGHLYPPGVPYWEDTRGETGYRHSAWVCFTGGEGIGLEDLVDPAAGYARFVDPRGRLGAMIRGAARIGHERGDAGYWRVQSLLCQIVGLLFESRPVEAETRRIGGDEPRLSPLVRAADRFLRDRLGEKVTLAEIARHAHVSVSTLSHRYREETGRTPMQTLTRLRVDHARSLLLRGLPLKVVAQRLGFTDAFHLSKTFKAVEGIPPREFLRRREG